MRLPFVSRKNTAAQISVVSHHCCICYVWHERVDIRPSGVLILAKAIRDCVHWCHYRGVSKPYVQDFPSVLRTSLVHDPVEAAAPQRVASYSLIAVTTIVTILAAWYIYRELNRVKPAVIYERRKARYIRPPLSFITFGDSQPCYLGKQRWNAQDHYITMIHRVRRHSIRTRLIQIFRFGRMAKTRTQTSKGPLINNGMRRDMQSAMRLTLVSTPHVHALQHSVQQRYTLGLMPQLQ